MSESLKRLSDYFSAAELLRDGSFAHLDEAGTVQPRSLVFCQNLAFLETANANRNVTAVITTPELAAEVRAPGVAVSVNPRLAFFRIYRQFVAAGLAYPPMAFGMGEGCDIHPSAVVSPRTRIGSRVTIAANAVIEDFVEIGDGSYIGANAVIGAEGMMTVWEDDGSPLVLKHAGGVTIGREVVILAGAVIAKSLYRNFTHVGDYCQIGILSNIGHGVRVGERCVISGNCIVTGRTTLGDHVWMGVSASVAPGLEIGAGAQIKMGSIVVRDVAPGQVVSGNFALPHNINMKHHLGLMRP
jgi:UDP-3-O-[3-hydroxymyristoyl] glucosamine N-acyltransferase